MNHERLNMVETQKIHSSPRFILVSAFINHRTMQFHPFVILEIVSLLSAEQTAAPLSLLLHDRVII